MHSAERHASTYKKANIEIPIMISFGHSKMSTSLHETFFSELQETYRVIKRFPLYDMTNCSAGCEHTKMDRKFLDIF